MKISDKDKKSIIAAMEKFVQEETGEKTTIKMSNNNGYVRTESGKKMRFEFKD